MSRVWLYLVCCFGLAACQPKGSFTYQHPAPETYPINQVVVVIDYLNLGDDVGKYWDFDSFYHQRILDDTFLQTKQFLANNGYPAVSAYLLSSGLLIDPEFAVEHYIQDQAQEKLLYPPYLLAQQNVTVEQQAQHQEFLTIMVKYLAQRRHHAADPLSLSGMQMGYHFQSMQLPDDAAIFYLHINQSAPGVMKQLGTLLLTGAIASQADYAHVGLDLSSQRQASAFWIHRGSGQILWKNHSSSWSTDQPLVDLLLGFPSAH
ncbi:hypothetical protein OS175_01490 [Marinicella sp. S1101]|uniref:hypothetical protein n=1 Tax=Marinicella marina TaxID=2996016 RepID=UPI00226104C7|nr:hypothetical protein [Marinicella marina]MCX7552535.1 hypothetical protein [Marinicella marina]MDJ1139411.1 hypothetical protein [Marinicella marina]